MEIHRKPVPRLNAGTLYADRYRIVAPIGRGGMGQVYLAEDTRLAGKRRALKLTLTAEHEWESFVREARILSELQHPNLPDIVDYYPPDPAGVAGIVMEYVAGDTLMDIFERSGRRLPFARVYRYLFQLSEVLCYLHGRQPLIVFRDLKPANVLIDGHDRAVLIDFGIARQYRPGAGSDTERLGTPAFAAPEQIRGEQTDARTDLYGWGAIAYYLLSGGQFAIRRSGSLRQALQSDVPPAFVELLGAVLAHDPAQRPQNSDRLRQLLLLSSAEDRSTDTNRGNNNGAFENGIKVTAILSAYPGAGATFAALGLSKALSSERFAHALVECPGSEPELYALLDGDRRKPKHASFADPAGQADAVPSWRQDSAFIYTLDPLGFPAAMPDDRFGGWIRKLGVTQVLLDVSSLWEKQGMADWLARHIQSVWWVADCLPAKWSARRQEACAALHSIFRQRGISSHWIANRDFRFAQREQWLSCFPARVDLRIPLYPAESAVQAAWRGEGIPSDGKSSSAGSRAFQIWAREVIESQGSYHLFPQPNNHVTMNA